MIPEYNIDYRLYAFALLSSLLFSYVTIYNTLPNNDGILYINTAKIYLDSGIKEALKSYHWLFYPALIAHTSNLTGLELINSAYLVNSIFQAIIVIAYINIFSKISPFNFNNKTNKQQYLYYIALLTILLFPQLNEYRHYIIREFGFWAFSLLAINNLLVYLLDLKNNNTGPSHSPSFVLSYQKSILYYYINFFMAFLFRGEALVIAAVLPMSVLLLDYSKQYKKQKLYSIYKPFLIFMSFSFALLCISLLIYSKNTSGLSIYNLINSLYINLHFNKLDLIFNTYTNNINILKEEIFSLSSISTFGYILFFSFGLFAIFVVKYISVFNLINLGLVSLFFYLYKAKFINKTNNNAIKLIVIIAFILALFPLVFLHIIFVTTGRYYILSSIVLLLLVPFSLDYLWQKIINFKNYPKYKYVINSSIGIILIAIMLDGLVSFGYSKDYLKQAGLWFKNNNYSTQSVYTNNAQVGFYANLKKSSVSTADKELNKIINKTNKNKYLILQIKHKSSTETAKINMLLENKAISVLQKFENKRGDSVIIIQDNHIQ